jgi:anti-sigma B factor antagonist
MPGQTAAQILEAARASRRTVNHAGAPACVEHPVPGQRIRIVGSIDAASVGGVRAGLHDAVDLGTGELIVELGGLELGDATGLGALLGAHRRANRAGRTMVLTDVPIALQRILAYTRLGRVLAIRDTVAVAS